jgi:Flp pilus assembly protein TadD/predicted aspartyl protease
MKSTDVRLRSRWAVLALLATMTPLCVQAQAGVEPSKDLRAGHDAMRRGRYEEAAERFEKAVAIAPDSAEARLGLSWAYLKQRKFLPSVEQAVKVLDRAPDNPRANALVGTVLMRVGILPDAAAAFKRSLAANAEEPLALAGLAELDLYAGNLGESLRRAREAVSRSPREADFLYLLGQTAARQERFEEAASAYEQYLTAAPDVDSDRRSRIRGLIVLYRRLANRNLYYLDGAKAADVPIDFTEGRLPFVSVTVNGKGPFRFVIDSGAGFVVVSDDLARKLKIRPIASGGTSRGVSGSGKFPIVYGILDRLSLGELTIENVPTYIRKVQDAERTKVDGYIGLSVLSNFMVAVDFERRVLELRPSGTPAAPAADGDIAVPYRLTNGGMMSVRADIGKDVPLNFIVDTGATSTVVSQRAYERFNLAEKQHKGVTVRVVGAGGVTENVPIVVLDRLEIQGADQRQDFVRALVLDLEPVNETAGFEQSGIIGSDFLRFYRVEFDFDRGMLILRPNARRGEDAPAAARSSGETS